MTWKSTLSPVAQAMSGTVKDSQSGKPIKRATVSLTVLGSATPTERVTDESGVFNFGSIDTGFHVMRVEAEGYMTHVQDINMSSNGPSKLNISLTKGECEINGRVNDKVGEPLRAELVLLKNGVVLKKVSSDENHEGIFSFKNLVEGLYEIQVSALCHSPSGWIGQVDGSGSEKRGQISNTADFELSVVEGCEVIARCDVCENTKAVKYCKFCHAYICQDCRHNYPERVRAMLKRRFSQRGRKVPDEKELDSIEEEMSSPVPVRDPKADCGGCY
jgi:hypothetical protein